MHLTWRQVKKSRELWSAWIPGDHNLLSFLGLKAFFSLSQVCFERSSNATWITWCWEEHRWFDAEKSACLIQPLQLLTGVPHTRPPPVAEVNVQPLSMCHAPSLPWFWGSSRWIPAVLVQRWSRLHRNH